MPYFSKLCKSTIETIPLLCAHLFNQLHGSTVRRKKSSLLLVPVLSHIRSHILVL